MNMMNGELRQLKWDSYIKYCESMDSQENKGVGIWESSS